MANGGSGIGEVTEFAMDTKWRLMRCRLQLAGAEANRVHIGKYGGREGAVTTSPIRRLHHPPQHGPATLDARDESARGPLFPTSGLYRGLEDDRCYERHQGRLTVRHAISLQPP